MMFLTDIISKVYRKIIWLFAYWVGKMRLSGTNIKVGHKLVLHGPPIVFVDPKASLCIGDRVVLCSWSKYTAMGVCHPVILRAMLPGASLTIGNDVGISGASICAAKKITIGQGTLIGSNVSIIDTDFHQITSVNRRYSGLSQAQSEEIIIEDNVFIGANSIILKGSHIGKNSVIGAGSVVIGKIPGNVIAAGNPCKVIKIIEVEERVKTN